MATGADFLNQFAFVNAVLGGFSIALAIGLLQLAAGRAATWATGAAFVAALALLLGTVAATFGAVWVLDRTELAGLDTPPATVRAAIRWSFFAFLTGVYALLVSVGLCGWIRSRTLGVGTSAAAGLVAVLIAYYLAAVVSLF